MTLTTWLPSVTSITSPTAAPDTSVTLTVTSGPFSAALMKPSLLASFTMVTAITGATLSTVAVVSALVLPVGSVAVTCSTVPLGGTVAGTML